MAYTLESARAEHKFIDGLLNAIKANHPGKAHFGEDDRTFYYLLQIRGPAIAWRCDNDPTFQWSEIVRAPEQPVAPYEEEDEPEDEEDMPLEPRPPLALPLRGPVQLPRPPPAFPLPLSNTPQGRPLPLPSP